MAGVLFLAAALLSAFFLPDYYSRWQDEQLLNKAHVEDRQITHLPTEKDKLVAEKIRILTESERFERVGRYDLTEQRYTTADPSVKWQEKLESQVEEWIRFGLLPEEFAELLAISKLRQMDLYTCPESGLNVLWMKYEQEHSFMDFIMDADGVCLYFVSHSIQTSAQDQNEQENRLAERVRLEGWEHMSLAERMEQESSFQLKEYCQADYVQRAGDGDTALSQFIGEAAYGSAFLFYENFNAEATSFCMEAAYEDTFYSGYGILLGSGSLISLFLRSNVENRCDIWMTAQRDPWENGAAIDP